MLHITHKYVHTRTYRHADMQAHKHTAAMVSSCQQLAQQAQQPGRKVCSTPHQFLLRSTWSGVPRFFRWSKLPESAM